MLLRVFFTSARDAGHPLERSHAARRRLQLSEEKTSRSAEDITKKEWHETVLQRLFNGVQCGF